MTHTTSRNISRRQLLDKAGIAAVSVIAISPGGPAQASPLAQLYPPQVLSIDADSVLRRGKMNAAGELVGETEEEQAALQAVTKKLMLKSAWDARWEDASGRALEAGTEEEQVAALYHFVWRTFLSSRITQVLTERTGQ